MLNLRIGFLLGWRQVQQSSILTSILIEIVIMFTLLNLVVINGVLLGIIDGVLRTVRNEAVGDIVIEPLPENSHVKDTERLLKELDKYDEIEAFSPRYEELATIEANFTERRDLSLERDVIAVNISGINPRKEAQTLRLSSLIVEGAYLDDDEHGSILIGKHYVDRYAEEYGDAFDSLKNIHPGSVVRVSIGDESKEFTVKGIVDSKIDAVSLSVFIHETDFRRMLKRADYNASKIVIRLKSEDESMQMRQVLLNAGFDKVAQVEAFTANIPKYVQDITKTFSLLSYVIGAISIFVASITVFIIILITIISRKRQIGILKAVGIRRRVLEYAYATQAGFYALTGILWGVIIIYQFLIPYFEKNPIDFPYTDVMLSVTTSGLLYRCLFLFIIMVIAGFIPAWFVTRQNTLDSILGRK